MKKVCFFLLMTLTWFGSASAQTNDGKTEALESIGVLSAVTVYNTYLAIGAVADGYGAAYDAEYAITLMEEQKNLLANTIAQLDVLLKSDYLDASDKEFVKQISECINYLKMEAETMSKYVSSESEADLDAYNFYRDRAWAMIEDLLGLKD